MKLIDVSTPKFPDTFAMVDDEDFEWLNQWKWYAKEDNNTIYALRHTPRPNRKILQMHRVVNKTPDGFKTDHRDGDGLNNQKSNLRTCTIMQNSFNSRKQRNSRTSKYIGVCFCTERNRFIADIQVMGKRKRLGYFKTEEAAREARDAAAIRLHGEFARLNQN